MCIVYPHPPFVYLLKRLRPQEDDFQSRYPLVAAAIEQVLIVVFGENLLFTFILQGTRQHHGLSAPLCTLSLHISLAIPCALSTGP